MLALFLLACSTGRLVSSDVGVEGGFAGRPDTGGVVDECQLESTTYEGDAATPLGFSAADLLAMLPEEWAFTGLWEGDTEVQYVIGVDPLDDSIVWRDYSTTDDVNCPDDVAAMPVLVHLEGADGRLILDADTEILAVTGGLDGLPFNVFVPAADNQGSYAATGWDDFHVAVRLDGEGYPGRVDVVTREEGGLIAAACTLLSFGDEGGDACP
jgi:hypothetical protein